MRRTCLICYLLLILKLTTIINCCCIAASHQQEEFYDTLTYGELIFLGTSQNDSVFSCVKCHNIVVSDTFSWYPGAVEIAANFANKDISDYEDVLLYGMTEQMYTSHEPAENYTEKEFYAIKAFLQNLNNNPPPKDKHPMLFKLIVLLICFLILLFTVADKFYFKLLRKRRLRRIIFTFTILFIFVFIYNDVISFGLQPLYEPDQPIKFSHKVHAQQNGIACIYCHPSVRYSASAGVSGTSVCMNCHSLIREGTHSGEYEIRKLIEANDNNTPIQWIRINNLPEHVKFNHSLHYVVGEIDCAECHGNVEELDRLKQPFELSMKWCLDCHKNRKVQFEGNRYYAKYTSICQDIVDGRKDSVMVKEMGGWECMNCHY